MLGTGGQTVKNKDKKRVARVGWMPFWWGNKFNKRLAEKRKRQKEKRVLKGADDEQAD